MNLTDLLPADNLLAVPPRLMEQPRRVRKLTTPDPAIFFQSAKLK